MKVFGLIIALGCFYSANAFECYVCEVRYYMQDGEVLSLETDQSLNATEQHCMDGSDELNTTDCDFQCFAGNLTVRPSNDTYEPIDTVIIARGCYNETEWTTEYEDAFESRECVDLDGYPQTPLNEFLVKNEVTAEALYECVCATDKCNGGMIYNNETSSSDESDSSDVSDAASFSTLASVTIIFSVASQISARL